jgi:hypothetical protein
MGKKKILHRGHGGTEGTEKKKQIPRFARNDSCCGGCECWGKWEAGLGGFGFF